jgi:hypothetical protein
LAPPLVLVKAIAVEAQQGHRPDVVVLWRGAAVVVVVALAARWQPLSTERGEQEGQGEAAEHDKGSGWA